MLPTVYIETTIPSYLAGRSSRDLLQAARQQITRDWWDACRHSFQLRTSQIVIDEATAGDPEVAKKRLEFLEGVSLLQITQDAIEVADDFVRTGVLPLVAARDALHVAVASIHEMDFLLTWNCRHIANAKIMHALERIVARHGFRLPVLCTPDQLLEA